MNEDQPVNETRSIFHPCRGWCGKYTNRIWTRVRSGPLALCDKCWKRLAERGR
jgi:hypothetical protein